jgi:hypothetical protein
MPRIPILLMTAALFGLPAAARAADPPGLISALGDFVRTINGSDDSDFAKLFAVDASITDTVYPYHWQGQDAAQHYFDDLQTDLKSVGWTDLHLVKDGDPFVVARPGFAYAAVHLYVDYKAHGSSHRDRGIFVLSLRQDGKHWKITSATWTYTRPPEEADTSN